MLWYRPLSGLHRFLDATPVAGAPVPPLDGAPPDELVSRPSWLWSGLVNLPTSLHARFADLAKGKEN